MCQRVRVFVFQWCSLTRQVCSTRGYFQTLGCHFYPAEIFISVLLTGSQFYKCVTQTRFCSLSHFPSNSFLFPLLCSYNHLEEESVFLFQFMYQILQFTDFQHHTVHSSFCSCLYISAYYLLWENYCRLLSLWATKRGAHALEVIFVGPFSFWLHSPEVLFYVCICMHCVCVYLLVLPDLGLALFCMSNSCLRAWGYPVWQKAYWFPLKTNPSLSLNMFNTYHLICQDTLFFILDG